MTKQWGMVQFQFHESFVLNERSNNWVALLSKKLNSKRSNHIFTSTSSGNIKKYKVLFDHKTKLFIGLEQVKIYKGHENWVTSILIIEDSNELMSCGTDKTVRTWCLDSGVEKKVKTMKITPTIIDYWNYQKKCLVMGFDNGETKVWDWETRKIVRIFKNHIFSAQFLYADNFQSQVLSIGSPKNKTIQLWCLNNLVIKKTFNHNDRVTSICFLDRSKTCFASCGWDKSIKIWDKETGKCLFTRENAHKSCICKLLYSFELKLLISCGEDAFIRIWSIEENDNNNTKKIVLKKYIESPFGLYNMAMQFLNSETRFLVSGYLGNFFVIDLILEKIVWTRLDSSEFEIPINKS